MKFEYYLPVNLRFGSGRIKELGEQAAKYGRKALIVTGKSSTKKSGLLDKAIALLKKGNISSVVFDKVEPNPLTTTAYAGAELAKNEGCDEIIGIGGGSIMDAAKAISFLSVNDGDISDYIFNKKSSDKALPIILVPTTCGTGSEGNSFAVLTNAENGDKKSLRCQAIVAKVSIIDPELMKTMPKSVLASVGFDALCHNMEAYLSKIGQPLTDLISLDGVRLIAESLPKIYQDYNDAEAWEKMTFASTLGGMAINTAGIVATHGMEHPASGLKNIVHGKGLAALTPPVFEESIKGAPKKFAAISRLLGGQNENDCVKQIRKLLKMLDLDITLSQLGISESNVDWMAENCLKVSAAGISNNPVVFTQNDLKRIYKEAL